MLSDRSESSGTEAFLKGLFCGDDARRPEAPCSVDYRRWQMEASSDGEAEAFWNTMGSEDGKRTSSNDLNFDDDLDDGDPCDPGPSDSDGDPPSLAGLEDESDLDDSQRERIQ